MDNLKSVMGFNTKQTFKVLLAAFVLLSSFLEYKILHIKKSGPVNLVIQTNVIFKVFNKEIPNNIFPLTENKEQPKLVFRQQVPAIWYGTQAIYFLADRQIENIYHAGFSNFFYTTIELWK